jgi:hypothetical protein
LQKPQSETLAKRKVAFQNDIAQRRATLEPFGSVPTAVSSSIVYLPEPIFIGISGESPHSISSFLKGTNIAPYNSTMKFFVPTVEYGADVFCDFWFYWFNDSDFQVVVASASSQTVLNGYVFGYISAPFLPVLANFEFFGFASGIEIRLYQQGAATPFVDVYRALDGFGMNAVKADQYTTFPFEYYSPNGSTAGHPGMVPPQTGVLIRVSPNMYWVFDTFWGEDDGEAGNGFNADFANDDLDYFVQCSGVMLEIQKPVVSEPGV